MSELYKKLKEYSRSDYLPMHMPGHKRRLMDFGNPYLLDITEIDGFDDLHHAKGILKKAEERAARMYGSEETHYLINGSTAGILSAISGCTTFGGTVLLARNSHKSAYHAALLKGLRTVYLYPEMHAGALQSTEAFGINGAISPMDVSQALEARPEIQAVFLTSPTYDGVVSDVRTIAKIAHQHGLPLIVDAAHGAHFPFSRHFPDDAAACGADVVIHGVHKTLPAMTQSALIHLNGSRIDREQIRNYLAIYQSSSPSYVLMAGIDCCMDWVEKNPEAFEEFWRELTKLREGLQKLKHLRLLEIPGMDKSKILVSPGNTGLDGRTLNKILRQESHIELEMACASYVCAITTVADTQKSLSRLLDAFQKADQGLCPHLMSDSRAGKAEKLTDTVIPVKAVCTIHEAAEREKTLCPIEQSEGRVSGGFVMLYPPGIPILAPGEIITRAIYGRIKGYLQNGYEIHGIQNGRIPILKKENGWEKYSA